MTPSDTRQAPVRTFDRFAADLHAVASVLTADPELADRLVLAAVTTPGAGAGSSPALRELSARVVGDWLEGHPEDVPTIVPAVPSPLDRLHGLPPDERAALALCRFGGHTYREAADVLGQPHGTVADLLTSSLRGLAAAPPAPEEVSGEHAV